MTPEQINDLFAILDKLVFLLQTLCIASSFTASGVLAAFMLHAKNQRRFF